MVDRERDETKKVTLCDDACEPGHVSDFTGVCPCSKWVETPQWKRLLHQGRNCRTRYDRKKQRKKKTKTHLPWCVCTRKSPSIARMPRYAAVVQCVSFCPCLSLYVWHVLAGVFPATSCSPTWPRLRDPLAGAMRARCVGGLSLPSHSTWVLWYCSWVGLV